MVKRTLSGGEWAILISLSALLILSYAVPIFLDDITLVNLLDEDGPVESIGAAAFLVAAMFFLLTFRKSTTGNDLFIMRTKRNILYLMLGLLCLFVFGEEISWGQRVLGYRTPEFIAEENLQGEVTLHNLSVFSSSDGDGHKKPWWDLLVMSRMFRIFLILFTFGIPLVFRFSSRMQGLIRSINIPVLPLWLGALFPVNYLLSKVCMQFISGGVEIVELEESNHAILLGTAAFLLSRNDPSELTQSAD